VCIYWKYWNKKYKNITEENFLEIRFTVDEYNSKLRRPRKERYREI
jgi:hypothetical protein